MEGRGHVFQKQGTVGVMVQRGRRQHILGLVKEVFPEAGDVPAAEDWVSGGYWEGVGLTGNQSIRISRN